MYKRKYEKEYCEEFLALLSKLKKTKETGFRFSICFPEFNVMCEGDISAARVLAQIFYWWRPSNDGDTKLRVKGKDGTLVLAKSSKEMAIEIGFLTKTNKPNDDKVFRAYKKLEHLGLIQIKQERFYGHRTSCITLNEEIFSLKFLISATELNIKNIEYKIECREQDADEIENMHKSIKNLMEFKTEAETELQKYLKDYIEITNETASTTKEKKLIENKICTENKVIYKKKKLKKLVKVS